MLAGWHAVYLARPLVVVIMFVELFPAEIAAVPDKDGDVIDHLGSECQPNQHQS